MDKLGKYPNLRYGGDAAKLRLAGTYVKTADQRAVVDAVHRFWRALGATIGPAATPAADEFRAHGAFGTCILPAGADADGDPWVGLYDSARYDDHAWLDERRQALAHYLGVPAWSFYLHPGKLASGESHYAGLARKSTTSWKSTVEAADRFPHPMHGYQPADALAGVSWIAISCDRAAVLHQLEFDRSFWTRSA
ncbi:MAG: hypothetical protein KBG28_26630 [Kofleriaceae bacterium]|nr:hypothetical protein [Kofleriaceae bacterium]